DGKLDLAIANSGDNSVSIFFGNGDGSFIPGGLFSGTGGTPESIAIGDLNRDGRPDLVVGMSDGGHISILFSDPDGGFDTNFTHVSVDGPTQPISVAIGDLNGDGSLDVATANRGSNNVSILFDGTFADPPNFAVGTNPRSVAIGDFNGDGKPDLAAANFNSGNVSILRGINFGNFGPATNFTAGSNPISIAVGDLNGDGKSDLAVANSGGGNVSILFGDGAGGFGPPINWPAGSNPWSVVIGDLNGDGKPDLAVANRDTPVGTVSVLLNDGFGAFGTPFTFTVGNGPKSLAIGDLDGDGKPDLAVANTNSTTAISILLNSTLFSPSGSFGPATDFAAGTTPRSVAIGDLNGDGKLDLAAANDSSNIVSILLGTGTGAFG